MKQPEIKYIITQYEVGTGQKLQTFETFDRLEALYINRLHKDPKKTTITSIIEVNPDTQLQGIELDLQNELLWSSWEVLR